ncbi:MAG TPA: hypothetical protein VK809_03795 [Bacteroidia bacterium]|jgi:hypothetical protein|nr:hypothetical protein [Bacteroidia bacterium]
MSNKQDIFTDDESIEKDSPLLHSISKENPFTVPENYFESLPSEIIEKCRTETQPKKWGEGILITLLGYKWKLLTITGCVVVICFFAIRLNNRPMSYEVMAQNIPDSLIVEHLDNNIAAINESTLEDFSEGISLGQDAENVKSESDSTNNDEDIVTYLVDNNISVTDISNE